MSEAVEMPFGAETNKFIDELPLRMREQIREIHSSENIHYTRESLAKDGINFDSLSDEKKREALAEHYLQVKASHDFDERHPELKDKGYKKSA